MSGVTVDVRTTIRGKVPRVPYKPIAEAVFGNNFELSLVVCGDDLAQRMNVTYRKKFYKPNVLSFPISKKEGEIFLNVRCAERDSVRYSVPLAERLALLFVHGCYHLKGLSHGRIMEEHERRALRAFGYQWHGESTPE